MATVIFIKESKQTPSAMRGCIRYCVQEKKTVDENGQQYVGGVHILQLELAEHSLKKLFTLLHFAAGAAALRRVRLVRRGTVLRRCGFLHRNALVNAVVIAKISVIQRSSLLRVEKGFGKVDHSGELDGSVDFITAGRFQKRAQRIEKGGGLAALRSIHLLDDRNESLQKLRRQSNGHPATGTKIPKRRWRATLPTSPTGRYSSTSTISSLSEWTCGPWRQPTMARNARKNKQDLWSHS